MEGWLELGHPQIESFLVAEAWKRFEQALGKQNNRNRSAIRSEHKWAVDYLKEHKRELIPKGVYRFNKQPYFHQKELKGNSIQCELVFCLSNTAKGEEALLPVLMDAFMDSARQYIIRHMVPALYQLAYKESLPYVSPCFGPGLFSTDIDKLPEYYHYLQVPKELAVLKGEMLSPLCSFIGAVYGLEKPFQGSCCDSCLSYGNCRFCMMQWNRL